VRIDSVIISFLLVAACSGPAVMPDAGHPDAGSPPDAGAPDSGAPDAGEPPDSGTPDSGEPPDSGQVDSGAPDSGSDYDGGALAPSLPCNDTTANVYITPAGTGSLGDIVRCAHDVTLDAGDLTTQLSGKGVTDITPSTGSDVFLIAYRTSRADGGPGVGTAKVFLPQVPRASPLPVIVVAHGTTGLADSCAPSKGATDTAEMTIPFAAQGYAVVAPDFAGLGNEGVQGYTDARDTAHSTLDAARALRKLLPAGTLSDQVAIIGHSQGGGAALASQSLAKSYGLDGTLSAVAVFAAMYQTRLNSFGFVSALRQPTNLTISLGISKPPVYVMRQYALEMNQLGSTTGGEGFPAAKSSSLVSAITTQCLIALGGSVQATSPHIADLIDDTLRTGFLSCVDGTGCSGAGQQLYDYLSGNILSADPTGAPVLYVQGSNDIIMAPAEEAACNVQKLNADGIVPSLCVDSMADHSTVVQRNASYVVNWVAATLAGSSLPACPRTGSLPACTP
jgi:pimeloyl-ACP methyl ester carboxylesterase